MTNWNDDELIELLGAYALDATSDAERAEVERFLERSADARAELACHYEVLAALATSPGEAPLPLWARIEAELDSGHLRTVGPVHEVRRSRRRARFGLAAASVAAVAMLGGQEARLAALRHDRDIARSVALRRANDLDAMRVALDRAASDDARVEQLLVRQGSFLATLVATDGAPLAKVVVGADGQGYLVGAGLPALPGGRTYQLWGVASGRVLSLGVFGAHPGTVAFAARDRWDTFVLTAEMSPGVVTSAGPALASGEVTVV
jgi:anti-sigma-K factor RskA